MVLILASNEAFHSPVRGKTATLRTGSKVTGDVVAARPGRFKDGDFWFLDETIRDADGTEHSCRLMSDSVRPVVGSRRLPSLKPHLIRFESEERARATADAIGRVARAYAEGRIKVQILAERSGQTTFQLFVEGETDPKVFELEKSAIEEAEGIASTNPDARISVTEVAGVIPKIPFGGSVDFDEVKEWTKANLSVGMWLVLEETHGRTIQYMPVQVTALPDKNGRFSVNLPNHSYASLYGDPRFYVSGKLYRAPTGQSRLLPPFREAVDLAVRGGKLDYSGKHWPDTSDDKATVESRDELSRQPVVPWTFQRPTPPGFAALAAALERATEHPVKKTVRRLSQRGIDARPVILEIDDMEDGAGEAEPEAAIAACDVAIEVLSLAQLRGAPKQVQWAGSILNGFRKARGLNRTGAVPTRNDEVVLGCATASLLIDHRDLLKEGNADAFVEAIGARWLEFEGIDAYRSTAMSGQYGKKSALAWHWHTVTIGGEEYCFEAVGHEQWVYKADCGRFAWIERGGKRRILEGTLRTVSKSGEAIVKGNRASKPQGSYSS